MPETNSSYMEALETISLCSGSGVNLRASWFLPPGPTLKKPIQNPSTHNLCYWRKQFLVRRLLQEPPAVPSTFSLVPSTSGMRKSLLLGIFLQACSTFYYCDKTLHKTSVLWTVHGQEGMWGRGEWVAICKQRGEDSEERWYPGSFRADEQPLGLWENKQQ